MTFLISDNLQIQVISEPKCAVNLIKQWYK